MVDNKIGYYIGSNFIKFVFRVDWHSLKFEPIRISAGRILLYLT